jgi:hypothetical protein
MRWHTFTLMCKAYITFTTGSRGGYKYIQYNYEVSKSKGEEGSSIEWPQAERSYS